MRRQHHLLGAIALLFGVTASAQPDFSRYSPRISTGQQVSLDYLQSGLGVAGPSTTYLGVYTFGSGSSCVQQGWTSVDLTAGDADFGSFAALFNGLDVLQRDLCSGVVTCVWGFFDGSTSDFACGGYPAQATVPAGDVSSGYLHNEIWSPVMPVAGSSSCVELVFDVYRELDLQDLVFYTWRVRSFASGVPGPWRDRGEVYYGAGRDWLHHVASIGDLVDSGATDLQVALGVVDMCGYWCGILGDGTCHSHAPLFDNVYVYSLDGRGPQWFVHPVDLFQDNFSTDGTTVGTVRVDIARDINPRGDPSIRPGDSLVVWVDESTVGLGVDPGGGPAVYLHVKDAAPGKSGAVISGDATRWPFISTANGWTVLRFDSVRADGRAVPGRFCVDLDDDLYVPGDTIAFYMSARDANGRVTYWTEFTGTTADRQRALDTPCEITCLPAAAGNGTLRALYVDDFDGRGAQPFVDTALQVMGIFGEVDRYDVRGPTYLAGNGLGSRVRNVASQLANPYTKIIWNCGNLSHGLVGDGSGRPEKSPDARTLVDFLTAEGVYRGLYLSGDDVAAELATLDGDGAAELRSLIEYTVVNDDHRSLGFGVSPLVIGNFGAFASHTTGLDTMVAYGGCGVINRFNVLAPRGNAVQVMRYDRGVAGNDGAIIAQKTGNALVVLSGFSFHYTTDATVYSRVPARAHHLHDILVWLTNPPPLPCLSSRLSAQVTESAVLGSWTVSPTCYELSAVRLRRYSEWDSVRVNVLIDSLQTASGDFVDYGADVGAWNTYELYGVPYASPPIRIIQTSVYVPSPLTLYQNMPNPFTTTTMIRFMIPSARQVTIEIYDVAGRKVVTLLDEVVDRAGENRVEWDGTDDKGRRVASGVYFCRMLVPGVSRLRKMVVVR